MLGVGENSVRLDAAVTHRYARRDLKEGRIGGTAMRKALAALLLSMLVLAGAPAAASAGEVETTCHKYTHSCKPQYPPKPPDKPDKPDKPHPDKPHPDKPETHKPATSSKTTAKSTTTTTTPTVASTTVASSYLPKTGADSSMPLLAAGGGMIVVGAAAYGASRLRRQN